MKKNKVPITRYVLVLLLTVMVFIFGVLLGNYFTTAKFEKITDIENNLRIQTQGAELQYLLLLQDPCKYVNSTPLADELYRISERLDYMESQRGEDDTDVQRLKNTYSILEIRHWLFVRKTNEQCGTNQVPILYFYSNKGDCPQCEEQGYTLTYLRRQYPDLRVYSFDVTSQNPALDTLKAIYQINETPTIILPHTRLGFTTVDDLRKELTFYDIRARE